MCRGLRKPCQVRTDAAHHFLDRTDNQVQRKPQAGASTSIPEGREEHFLAWPARPGDPSALAGSSRRGRAHVETQMPSSPCSLLRPSQAQRESRCFSHSHGYRKGQQRKCYHSHCADKHVTPRCRAGGSDGVLKVLSSVWPSQNPLFMGSRHPC